MQSDLTNAGKKLELFHVDNGRYPNTTVELTAILDKVNTLSYAQHSNALSFCVDSAADSAAIGGVSASGKGWVYRVGSGLAQKSGWSMGGLWTICANSVGITVPVGSFGAWRSPAGVWAVSTRPL